MADITGCFNNAISIKVFIPQKYTTPEEQPNMLQMPCSMRDFEDAVKKIKRQRERRPEERVTTLSHYR